MAERSDLGAPLTFHPVYQQLVWGGRRMKAWRPDLPDGPIGEAWDLADHARGMSVVARGPLAGTTLNDLVKHHGTDIVGAGFSGATFPLMVKFIDATDKLSIQVHPDDALARGTGVGNNGKTECWFVIDGGSDLYQGTKPGVDRAAFEHALAAGNVASTLNKFNTQTGDFFFLPARTVHALDAGCLLLEVQQTSDATFRVHDWNRVGLDGKPRTLHVRESLACIDFSLSDFGPRRPGWQGEPAGGQKRILADCHAFTVEQRRAAPHGALIRMEGQTGGRCVVLTCISGGGVVSTAHGSSDLHPTRTVLIPACAGKWCIETRATADVLVARPK